MAAKQRAIAYGFLGVCLLALPGCTYVYEYHIEGRVVSLQDGAPVGDLEVTLETTAGTKVETTTSEGSFSFAAEFVDQDFDYGRADCTLSFLDSGGKLHSVDVSLAERPANQSVTCLVFIVLP